LLCARRALEAAHLRTVERLAARVYLVPWQAAPPTGRRALLDLVTKEA
jgi:hypothetical protein